MARFHAYRVGILYLAAFPLLHGCTGANELMGPVKDVTVDRAASAPAPAVRVTGGGTTTFGVDLDGDGDIDGSHFGFAALISSDGSAKGHFTCLMAGNADILGLHLMAVQGTVTSGAPDGHSFSGSATVKVLNAFGNGVLSMFHDVPFIVVVAPGGAGIGTLQLTVLGAFDGVAGDTAPGNGNYDLAVETLTTGRITIQ